MARRLHNWSYREVIAFLRENDFVFFKTLGSSHERWIKHGESSQSDRIVEVNFTNKSYPVKTLKTMIRQSDIDENQWISWSGS
jgi:predicted RNA binding protein YcfA (HicA-like mRNA interferase family)